jgi:hypothetical protein
MATLSTPAVFRKLTFALLGFFALLMSSCATSRTTAVTKIKPQKGYVNLMVVFIDKGPEIQELNETTYNSTIRNKFNNLTHIRLREQLEKTMARNVSTEATLISGASEYFPVNEDIDYNTFIKKIKDTGAEGILLVNRNARWNRQSYTTYSFDKESNISVTDTETAPNGSFLCYLFDLNNEAPVWVSQSSVLGTTWDSPGTLNSSLARNISRKLVKAGFIYSSVSQMQINYQ